MKVQRQKYKIQIRNARSLRVILEHPRAKELYREVVLSLQSAVGSRSGQLLFLLFVIADLLFRIKVQRQKYKIQIRNSRSLRVILEHLSAKELYREVVLSL